jgi:hypothetical protein
MNFTWVGRIEEKNTILHQSGASAPFFFPFFPGFTVFSDFLLYFIVIFIHHGFVLGIPFYSLSPVIQALPFFGLPIKKQDIPRFDLCIPGGNDMLTFLLPWW